MSDFNKESNSFYLFAIPTFIGGVGQALDVDGSELIFNESQTPDEADCIALKNDWIQVGKDLKSAIHVYEESISE